jgi:hypothetical protein
MGLFGLVLKLTAFGGLIIFMAGILNLPPIGGETTLPPEFSLPPKPSVTSTPGPAGAAIVTVTPVATVLTPKAAGAGAGDTYTIITSSNGFKLVITGVVIFVVSAAMGMYYRKDDEGTRRILPGQTGV